MRTSYPQLLSSYLGFTQTNAEIMYFASIGRSRDEIARKLGKGKKEVEYAQAKIREETGMTQSQLVYEYAKIFYAHDPVAYHLESGVPWPEVKELPRGQVVA